MQLTLEADASVAEVARAHGVNANQVFKSRRGFERDELAESRSALLPVKIAGTSEPPCEVSREEHQATTASGSIHVELPAER